MTAKGALEPPILYSDIQFNDGDTIKKDVAETDIDSVIAVTETRHRVIATPADVVRLSPGDTIVRAIEGQGAIRDEIAGVIPDPDGHRGGIHVDVAGEDAPWSLHHLQQLVANGQAYIHGIRTRTKRVSVDQHSE